MFGKKISSGNIRRIIRRLDWTTGSRYEIYRDDYSAKNQSPNTLIAPDDLRPLRDATV